MRKVAIFVLALSFGAIGWAGNGVALTIVDDYIGADPVGTRWDGKDVVGDGDFFDISRMEVNLVGGQFVVDVYSTYFDNIGKHGTELGDLFVSINTSTEIFAEYGFKSNSIDVTDIAEVTLLDESIERLVDDFGVVADTFKSTGRKHALNFTVHLIKTVFK